VVDLKRTELRVHAERAVLIQLRGEGDGQLDVASLEELRSLARTAHANVVGEMWQARKRPDPASYLGRGKVEELGRLCRQKSADLVICDDDLSPAQVKALETRLDVKVADRSELILDVFATHARTRQAKLQVELAQLEYALPRLKKMWTHLDRTAGGMVAGGIGVRGPGEKQLEVDRRLVQKRIYDLRRALKKIERRRRLMVRQRTDRFRTVTLVGYTNAGKSTLMNALTGAGVRVRDHLFETLDTRTRKWTLPDGTEVLLSDTVGFIRKLPHHLVASFHATLEEALEADLLLHVADASNPTTEAQVDAVAEVLSEIGCADRPTLLVLNKVDAAERPSNDSPLDVRLPLLAAQFDRVVDGGVRGGRNNALPASPPVCISALTGTGLEDLAHAVMVALAACRPAPLQVTVRTAVGNGRLLSLLYERGTVLDQTYDGAGGVALQVKVPPALKGVIESLGGRMV
jgi:GTP-binding protein HflX